MLFNLLFLLAFIVLLLSNIASVQRDIRHPSNIFLFVWIITYILYNLDLVNYVVVSLETHLIIFLTSLAFVFFSHLGEYSYIARREISHFKLPVNRLLILGYLGLIAALGYYQVKFGLDQLIFNPGYVRANDKGGTGLLGLIIFLPTILFVIIAIDAFLKRKFNVSVIIYLSLIIVYMLILPERTTFINTIVWTGLSIYATNKRLQTINIKTILRLLPIISLIVTLFLGFFVAVSQRTGKVAYISSIEYALNYTDTLPLPIYDPYIYLTGSLPALSQVIDSSSGIQEIDFQPSRTTLFFNRGFQILGLAGGVNKLTVNKEFGNIPFLFNTYTWLYDPLEDYGIIGTIIYAALCGYACGITWKLGQRLNHPITYFLYGWGATASVFCIMTNKFASIYFTYAFILATISLLYYLFILSLKSASSYRRRV